MNYDEMAKDFSTRTKYLVENYKGEYEVTFLLNCCLGLIVVPKEKDFDSIPNDEIPLQGALWGLTRQDIRVGCDTCGYKLRHVIRRIRNGICHFKLESIPDEDGQISSLTIHDSRDFDATLTVPQLREFALSLTRHVYKL
jgi:hypothetical protein